MEEAKRERREQIFKAVKLFHSRMSISESEKTDFGWRAALRYGLVLSTLEHDHATFLIQLCGVGALTLRQSPQVLFQLGLAMPSITHESHCVAFGTSRWFFYAQISLVIRDLPSSGVCVVLPGVA